MAKRIIGESAETESTATPHSSAASSSHGKKQKAKTESKDSKRKKAAPPPSSDDDGDESSSELESPESETLCNNLAMQLGLGPKQLKLKACKIVKVEDLSGEQLTFLLAQTAKKLQDLSVFSLYEIGGELVGLRKGCNDKLMADAKKQSKKKRTAVHEDAKTKDLCGLEISQKKWQSRLCQVYEFLGFLSTTVVSIKVKQIQLTYRVCLLLAGWWW